MIGDIRYLTSPIILFVTLIILVVTFRKLRLVNSERLREKHIIFLRLYEVLPTEDKLK